MPSSLGDAGYLTCAVAPGVINAVVSREWGYGDGQKLIQLLHFTGEKSKAQTGPEN